MTLQAIAEILERYDVPHCIMFMKEISFSDYSGGRYKVFVYDFWCLDT